MANIMLLILYDSQTSEYYWGNLTSVFNIEGIYFLFFILENFQKFGKICENLEKFGNVWFQQVPCNKTTIWTEFWNDPSISSFVFSRSAIRFNCGARIYVFDCFSGLFVLKQKTMIFWPKVQIQFTSFELLKPGKNAKSSVKQALYQYNHLST